MKKVFMYIHSLHIGGGAENVMFSVAAALRSSGFDIVVCGMVDEYPSFEEQLVALNIKVYRLSLTKKNILSLPLNIFKIIKRERPDALISWLWPAVVTGGLIAKLSGVKVRIANLRGPALNKSRLKVYLDRVFLKFYTNIIAVSGGVKNIFIAREKADPAKIDVIPNGLEFKSFNYDIASIRRELGIAKQDFVIGSVGRIYPEKNHKYFVTVAKLLKQKNSDFKIVLVGSGPAEEALRQEIKVAGLENNFLLAGWQSEIYKYLSVFDIFVLPSKYEGHPSSVLQAWLLKKPVLGAKVTGIKDVITDGYNGLLFSLSETQELSNTLLNLRNMPEFCQKIAENGYNTLKENYDIKKMYQNYQNYIEKLCK